MMEESHGNKLLTGMKSFWGISLHGDVSASGEINHLPQWRSGGTVCVGEVKLSFLIICGDQESGCCESLGDVSHLDYSKLRGGMYFSHIT